MSNETNIQTDMVSDASVPTCLHYPLNLNRALSLTHTHTIYLSHFSLQTVREKNVHILRVTRPSSCLEISDNETSSFKTKMLGRDKQMDGKIVFLIENWKLHQNLLKRSCILFYCQLLSTKSARNEVFKAHIRSIRKNRHDKRDIKRSFGFKHVSSRACQGAHILVIIFRLQGFLF